jgi:hypothetical protein
MSSASFYKSETKDFLDNSRSNQNVTGVLNPTDIHDSGSKGIKHRKSLTPFKQNEKFHSVAGSPSKNVESGKEGHLSRGKTMPLTETKVIKELK